MPSGYRLDNFDFVKADPISRPKRAGPGGRTINVESALKLYEIVKDGNDATDNLPYETETEARSVSQSASRLLRVAINHLHLEDKFTSSTRVWSVKGKWQWRVFLREVADDNISEKVANTN